MKFYFIILCTIIAFETNLLKAEGPGYSMDLPPQVVPVDSDCYDKKYVKNTKTKDGVRYSIIPGSPPNKNNSDPGNPKFDSKTGKPIKHVSYEDICFPHDQKEMFFPKDLTPKSAATYCNNNTTDEYEDTDCYDINSLNNMIKAKTITYSVKPGAIPLDIPNVDKKKDGKQLKCVSKKNICFPDKKKEVIVNNETGNIKPLNSKNIDLLEKLNKLAKNSSNSSDFISKFCNAGNVLTMTFTVRSYEGSLCESKPMAALSQIVCGGNVDFQNSKCASNISPMFKKDSLKNYENKDTIYEVEIYNALSSDNPVKNFICNNKDKFPAKIQQLAEGKC